jgi:hypothetical protein
MMAQRRDKSGTLTLRYKAIKRVNKHYNRLKKAVRVKIKDERFLQKTVSGTKPRVLTDNPKKLETLKRRYVYPYSPEKLGEFRRWVMAVSAKPDDSGEPKHSWLSYFIEIAYRKGIDRSKSDLPPEISLITPRDPYKHPAHIRQAQLIYMRAYTQLDGIDTAVANSMTEVLADGILHGKGMREITRNFMDKIDSIGAVRARRIVRTEIVHASNLATVHDAKRIAKAIGREVKLKWSISGHDNVRLSHRKRDGKVYTVDRAIELIGEPNCYCTVSPWLPEFDK